MKTISLSKLFFVLLFFLTSFTGFAQTLPHRSFSISKGGTVRLREHPDPKSPVTDSIAHNVRTPWGHSFYLVDDSDPVWAGVEIPLPFVVRDRKGNEVDYEIRYVKRYLPKAEMYANAQSAYGITDGAVLHVRAEPNVKSPVTDTLTAAKTGGFDVLGSPDARWVKIELVEFTNKYNRKGKVAGYDTKYYIRYIDGESFAAGTFPRVITEEYTGSVDSRLGRWFEKLQKSAHNSIDMNFDTEKWFPIVVPALLIISFLIAFLLSKKPLLSFALRYIVLTLIFFIEVVYIAVLGNDFWFCEPEQVGWGKAILFIILTLVAVYVQFISFFGILNEMKARSRYFNTSIGILLFIAIALVAFIYAIFTGGLDDEQNFWLIMTLVGTQALQVLVSAVQLRRWPLYALMVIIFIPLGTFAILLAALSVFKFLVLLAIFALAFFGLGSGRSEGRASGNSGSRLRVTSARECSSFIQSEGKCGISGARCMLMEKGKCDINGMEADY